MSGIYRGRTLTQKQTDWQIQSFFPTHTHTCTPMRTYTALGSQLDVKSIMDVRTNTRATCIHIHTVTGRQMHAPSVCLCVYVFKQGKSFATSRAHIQYIRACTVTQCSNVRLHLFRAEKEETSSLKQL